MKKNLVWIALVVIAGIILSACTTKQAPPQSVGGSSDPPPVAVVKAREVLAAELNVGVRKVVVESYERMEWTDSCLGLGGPAESCLAAKFPGWLVVLDVGGNTYQVRTDELGETIRIE